MNRNHCFSYTTIRKMLIAFVVLSMVALNGCGYQKSKDTPALDHRYATKEEGRSLVHENKNYYKGFSQNEIEYRMQKKGAGIDDLVSFAQEQVMEFTTEEKALLDGLFEEMENSLKEKNYSLPPLEEIVLIKTTMKDESEADAYTHGTQIYLNGDLIKAAADGNEELIAGLKVIMWHELFHCITRCNPDFRKEMYRLIRFTITDKEFPIPPSVFEYHITNPDVEHHDSYATFVIDGRNIDCFTDMVTTKHFENEGDDFFDSMTTALIPIDGTDVYYTPKQVANFDEIFGKNTDYVIDPEECMADNFAYSMVYGMNGKDGKPYPNPEIIEGILSYLQTK